MTLHKDGIPFLLLKRLGTGEERTKSEWARVLKTNKSTIEFALHSLRKNNHMYYPVGGTGKKAGIVKDVVKSVKDNRETSERLANNYTNPHIIASFRLMENFLIEHPKYYDEIEMGALNLVSMVNDRRKLLLKVRIEHAN